MQKTQHGFTLIELIIVVAIIGILSAIVVPQYGSFVRDARRTDGHVALRAAAQEMERCRTQNFSYATCTPGTGTTTSDDGHYTIALSTDVTPTATVYELTATAPSGSAQHNDTDCKTMSIDQTGQTTPAVCW